MHLDGCRGVFMEGLWRSLKHEHVYLKGYADGHEAQAGIGSRFAFYNIARPAHADGCLAGRSTVDSSIRLWT